MNTTTATTVTPNLMSHTGMVHRSRLLKGQDILIPACISRTQASRMHYALPTDAPVTCSKCGVDAK